MIAALAHLRPVVGQEAECERAGRVLLKDGCAILTGCIAAEGAVCNVCLLCPAQSTHTSIRLLALVRHSDTCLLNNGRALRVSKAATAPAPGSFCLVPVLL